MEKATLGGGCFWCTDGIFRQLKGVNEVVSGYSGGFLQNPTTDEVYSGNSGHIESVQITFDPKEISYKDILYIFFKTHDPTSLDKQGYDVGQIYRSVVFYHNSSQKNIAQKVINTIQKDYPAPIVTELKLYKNFYKADEHHQDFYNKFPNKPYCMIIIDPKIQKLRRDFKTYLKK